jgi:hypothetical protein
MKNKSQFLCLLRFLFFQVFYLFQSNQKVGNAMPDQELMCLYDMRRADYNAFSGEETIFWSDTKGWTDEVGAQRFTPDEISAKISNGFFEENTIQVLDASVLDTQRLYVISLRKNGSSVSCIPTVFPCFAESLDSAYEQARSVHPDGESFNVIGRHGQHEDEDVDLGPTP